MDERFAKIGEVNVNLQLWDVCIERGFDMIVHVHACFSPSIIWAETYNVDVVVGLVSSTWHSTSNWPWT